MIRRPAVATGARRATARGGVFAIFVLFMSVGCDPGGDVQDARLASWLLCEECTAGELDSIVARGENAVPALGRALRGPPPDRRDDVRRQLIYTHDRIVEYAANHPGDTLALSRSDFVDHFLANYDAAYQTRAAVALGRIGTPSARAELAKAIRLDSLGLVSYRPDVLRTIQTALGAPAGIAGEVSGVITDRVTGARVSAVAVQLEGTSIGAITTGSGRFSIVNVPPGTYDVRAYRPGYQVERRLNIAVGSGQTVVVDITLEPEP